MTVLVAIILPMKSKRAKTLRAIYATPMQASIAFSDIESFLLSIGATLHEREGSRIKFTLGKEEWHAHRPHPGKEVKKYQVEGAREFLNLLEIRP